MFRLAVINVVLWSAFATGVSCVACLWDRDTLAMERQRFPDVLELITGKFLRHSDEFYRWRIADRNERIAAAPNPELYDDLAVAYEKIGATEDAIRTIERKAEWYPGLYETHANLGTFHVHAGAYDVGLAEIDNALAINPEAHFGRERYQKLLVEYLSRQRQGEESFLPLTSDGPNGIGPVGFGEFLLKEHSAGTAGDDHADVIDAALTGVLGMMKFGNFDSPVLLEVLADLLLSRGFDSDAKRLAARAYLKASYESDNTATELAYRQKAEQCLKLQTKANGTDTRLSLSELELQFKAEVKEALAWYETVVEREKTWIEQGVDVEKAFEREFYTRPVLSDLSEKNRSSPPSVPLAILITCIVAAFGAIPLFLLRQRNKSKAGTA